MFRRANTDPYFNRLPAATQYILGGFSDIDRRATDRGNLYVSDINDSHPGNVRLKVTPVLGVASPGPASGRTGYYQPPKPCCGQWRPPEDDEDERDCIADVKNFLDSLPSPDEYKEQLFESELDGCASYWWKRHCNMFTVTIYHYVVGCVTPWGGGWPCCGCNRECDCCGNVVSGHVTWCETYIFPNCAAAQAFAEKLAATRCTKIEYCVGDPCILTAIAHYCTGDDAICQNMNCQLYTDKTSPVAYDHGSGYDCGNNATKEDRQKARDDSAWAKTVC